MIIDTHVVCHPWSRIWPSMRHCHNGWAVWPDLMEQIRLKKKNRSGVICTTSDPTMQDAAQRCCALHRCLAACAGNPCIIYVLAVTSSTWNTCTVHGFLVQCIMYGHVLQGMQMYVCSSHLPVLVASAIYIVSDCHNATCCVCVLCAVSLRYIR